MPKIYRTMKKDDDGKPTVDAPGRGLGVRVEPANVADVDLSEEGFVILNGKGMSVAPSWRALPPWLISIRLKDKFPIARGATNLFCFTMGEGPFENGPVSDDLDLLVEKPTHGLVAPREFVPLAQFLSDLSRTRDHWIIDEI